MAAKTTEKKPAAQTPTHTPTSAELTAQVKKLQEQAREMRKAEKLARDAEKAKSVKSLHEIDETQRDERAPWLYGYIIVRVTARERAGQSREEALACVLDHLRAGVREEMALRDLRKEARKAKKTALHAEKQPA
jgi:hypothetical protein